MIDLSHHIEHPSVKTMTLCQLTHSLAQTYTVDFGQHCVSFHVGELLHQNGIVQLVRMAQTTQLGL